MTHNIQLEKNQTDCHFCFWDGLTHWLHNSINRRCFCTFHALRSQRNHWAATEGSPYYYQLAEPAGKCDTAERRRRASLGTNTEEEWRSQPESRIRTFLCEVQTSADSCLFCFVPKMCSLQWEVYPFLYYTDSYSAVPAVVSSVWLDAAALGAFVHHLSWFELQTFNELFGCVSFRHSTLRRREMKREVSSALSLYMWYMISFGGTWFP